MCFSFSFIIQTIQKASSISIILTKQVVNSYAISSLFLLLYVLCYFIVVKWQSTFCMLFWWLVLSIQAELFLI